MSVLGSTALYLQTTGAIDLVSAVNNDVATAMFVMLEGLPMSGILSFVAIILVTVFFVTSSDSGSLVVDHLTSGGKLASPVQQRIFWAIMEGAIASVLLVGGGLDTLRAASVSTGLLFAGVILVGVYSLYMGLSRELYVETAVQRAIDTARDDYHLKRTVALVDR